MITINPLISYKNGNYRVSIFEDGTKLRETEDLEFIPDHPESVDLKITDFCDAGCVWCHEDSTKLGKHASIENLLEIQGKMPIGMEIAIGGGNPLDHPQLDLFLESVYESGKFANLTMNSIHLFKHKNSNSYISKLRQYLETKRVRGLGVSLNEGSIVTFEFLDRLAVLQEISNSLVFHAIAGVTKPEAVRVLLDWKKLTGKPTKLLVLGFKEYGRGIGNKDKENIDWWKKNILNLILEKDLILCFDTLGVFQLRVDRHLAKEYFDEVYLGGEGTFTFYIDAVRMQFAKSSYSSERFEYENLIDSFNEVRNLEN